LSACNNPKVTDHEPYRRPIALAVILIVGGVIGWYAAFALTVEKFVLLSSPDAVLGCDFSILVQCRANLESWQGSVFGFPNPILGLTGWMAPVVVGAAILAGARFSRWFWITFNVGVAGAMLFVIWLIGQSLYELNTLCPWCMVTWAVTIPVFLAVTLHSFRSGVIPVPPRLQSVAGALYGWIPALTLAGYLVVAVLAQIRLDVISYL
jgi:uncharacterized membrane protein